MEIVSIVSGIVEIGATLHTMGHGDDRSAGRERVDATGQGSLRQLKMVLLHKAFSDLMGPLNRGRSPRFELSKGRRRR